MSNNCIAVGELKGFVLLFLVLLMGTVNAASFVKIDANGIMIGSGEKVKVYTECIDDEGKLFGGELLTLKLYRAEGDDFVDTGTTFNAVPCWAKSYALNGTESLSRGFYMLKAECLGCSGNKQANAFFSVRPPKLNFFVDEFNPFLAIVVFGIVLAVLRGKKK